MKRYFNRKYLKIKIGNSNLNELLDKYKNILSFSFWNLLNINKNKYLNYLRKRHELLKEVEKLDIVNKQKFFSDIVWSFKDKVMLFYDIIYMLDNTLLYEIAPQEYMERCKQAIFNFCEYTFEFSAALNKTEQKLAEIKRIKQSNNSIFKSKLR